MAANHILEEDWTDYEKKKKQGEDPLVFRSEEPWEVEYLVKKIAKRHNLKEEEIRKAIGYCNAAVRAPRPREIFVECILRRLRLT